MSAKPNEVRRARQYLRHKARAGTRDIPPRMFADASRETGLGFSELLSLIARLQSQGQSAGQFRQELLLKAVSRGRR